MYVGNVVLVYGRGGVRDCAFVGNQGVIVAFGNALDIGSYASSVEQRFHR